MSSKQRTTVEKVAGSAQEAVRKTPAETRPRVLLFQLLGVSWSVGTGFGARQRVSGNVGGCI